ncbi:MAG: hypothetical protein EBS24_04030 [Chitinophagia bacterium]|nr:hypothetical protein [Chitinophagia bacterium]
MILNYIFCIAFILNACLCLAQSNNLEALSSKADSLAQLPSPQMTQLKEELELRRAILNIYDTPEYRSAQKAELPGKYGSTAKLDSLIKQAYSEYLIHELSEDAASYKIQLYDLLKVKENYISIEGEEELSSVKTDKPELQSLIDKEEQRIKSLNKSIQKQSNIANSPKPQKPAEINAEVFNQSSIIKQVITANIESGHAFNPKTTIDNKSFEDRKAFMPRPLAESNISNPYNPSAHSIELSSEKNTVSAVCQGEVIYAKRLGGSDYTLIIMHDNNYFTVFSGLQSVYVGYGDVVNYKQAIGIVKKAGDSRSRLSFGVWKGTKSLDPMNWIKNG